MLNSHVSNLSHGTASKIVVYYYCLLISSNSLSTHKAPCLIKTRLRLKQEKLNRIVQLLCQQKGKHNSEAAAELSHIIMLE